MYSNKPKRRIFDAPSSRKDKLNEGLRATLSIHREVRMCAKAEDGRLKKYCKFSNANFMKMLHVVISYMPEGRGSESRSGHWTIFSIYLIFPDAVWPWVPLSL
jgi:hypothetical protein